MIKIADASIKTFPLSSIKTGNAQPDEQIFVLASSQLQDIIEKATEPLLERITALEDIVASQNEKIAALETMQLQDIDRISLDIAQDRQRISRLERIEPQPLQKDRGEILMALIATNGGKMLTKDVRQKMRLDKATFSRLLDTLAECIEKKPYHLDRRQEVLIIK
jgi:hypothetical protein